MITNACIIESHIISSGVVYRATYKGDAWTYARESDVNANLLDFINQVKQDIDNSYEIVIADSMTRNSYEQAIKQTHKQPF